MPKSWSARIGVVVVLLTMQGCSSIQGVHVRGYMEDKPRVDQEIEGNQGYLLGGPPPDAKRQVRPTRRIYVLEITKDLEPSQREEAVSPEESKPLRAPSALKAPSRQGRPQAVPPVPTLELPRFEDEEILEDVEGEATQEATPATSASTLVEYKVKKDDTLQKISKKFYGGYSKWPRIYEANKKIIKSPDQLKPGLILNIPME